MKTKLLFTSLFCLLISAVSAQPIFEWANGLSGAGIIYNHDVSVGNNDEVVTVGKFQGTVDFDPGLAVSNLTSNGSYDIFIQKVDANGDFLWAHKIGWTDYDEAIGVCHDASGNIYITGKFRSTNVDFDPGVGVSPLSTTGNFDLFVLKLDSNGNFLWVKTIGDSVTSDEPLNIAYDPAGAIVIGITFFAATMDFDPGPGVFNMSTMGNFDAVALKLDLSGNFVWAKQFSGVDIVYIHEISVDINSNVLIGGYFNTSIDLDPGPATLSPSTVGGSDMFIVKLNPLGNYVWGHAIGSTGSDNCNSLDTDSNGDVVIGVEIRGDLDIDPGPGTVNVLWSGGGSSPDAMVARFDASGNFMWHNQVSGTGNKSCKKVRIGSTGNIYAAGEIAPVLANFGGYLLTGTGGKDIYLHGMNSSGITFYAESFVGAPSSTDYVLGYELSSTEAIHICGINIHAGTDFDPGPGVENLNFIAASEGYTVKLLQCSNSTSTISPLECFSYTSPSGNYTWSVTGNYQDTIPNIASCDSIITINLTIGDNLAPVTNVATLSNATSECSVSNLTAPTATDNCTGSITGTHNATLPITAQGTTTIIWTYDDGNGNTSTQTQNVIINADVTAPLADAGSLGDINAVCSVTSLTPPTATDNCIGAVTGTTSTSLPITAQGTTVVTWTYDDGNGNTSTQTQNVIINDVTAPVAIVGTLSDVTAECSINSLTAPTAADNCVGTVTGTPNVTLPITTQGSFTVTWTYDDGNGNTSTQTQNVIITDAVAPVADLGSLAPVTAECQVTSVTAPTATDNCVGSITGTHNATLPITTQGTTTVTWTYDDGNGNTSTQTQDIVITDATAPAADLANLADVNSECDVTPTASTATDNCAGAVTGTPDVTFPITAIGTTTVTWTYDDGNGNTSTQTQNVVITPIDNGITQVDAITLSADATGYNYQWVDCGNGNAPVSGATSQSFTPTIAGNYACEIDNGTCTVTTACLSSTVSIFENNWDTELVEVYPNPTSGNLKIDLGEVYKGTTVKVFNALGQIIINESFGSTGEINIEIEGTPGMYILEINTEEGKSARVNVIKE
jgi:hypothetical protein